MVDVLIVGAGPAGSAAAIHLARAGWAVHLVDRCRFPRRKPCGEYFNPEACRLLRELGVLPALEAGGISRIVAMGMGTAAACEVEVPFACLASSSDFAFSTSRESLDAVLVDATRSAGALVWEETLVREPLVEEGVVRGAVVQRHGETIELRSRITLAADGLRSRFARRLGLGRGDGGRRKLGLTARFDAAPLAPARVEMHVGEPGCCGVVIREEEVNLGMVADVSWARAIGGAPSDFVAGTLGRFPPLASLVQGPPRAVQTVGPLTWTTYSQATAGCLLLGDAAGFYDPFTGQGVTFALLTAGLAAEVADGALSRGDVSGLRLAEYARQRRLLLEPRILVQRAIQAVVARPALLDRVLDRLRCRPDTALTLLGVIADRLPAARAFAPGFLARLFV